MVAANRKLRVQIEKKGTYESLSAYTTFRPFILTFHFQRLFIKTASHARIEILKKQK